MEQELRFNLASKNFTPGEPDLLHILPGKTDVINGNLWMPVWMHLCDTAGIAEKLVNYWIPLHVINMLEKQVGIGRLSDYARLLGYLHDIGKMTPSFSSKILKSLQEHFSRFSNRNIFLPNKSLIKHNVASEVIIRREKWNFPESFSAIIGAHHGKPLVCNFYGEIDNIKEKSVDTEKEKYRQYYGNNRVMWESVWDYWINYCLDECGYTSAADIPLLDEPAQMLLSGLLVVSDWIASNTEFFPLIDIDFIPHLSDYSEERVENAWSKIRLSGDLWDAVFCADPQSVLSDQDDISGDFKRTFGFLPNEIQKKFCENVLSHGNGIYILEAPMGKGKTEAALYSSQILANKNGLGGMFFGLPTQATANGIFTRLKEWGEKQSSEARLSIELAHSAADLNDDYFSIKENTEEDYNESGLYVNKWMNGSKKTLLPTFVTGTVDQLLMAGLTRKHVMIKHLGIAGKVIIIDECHAYDAFMNVYLDKVLAWLGSYRTPVIILSATLPASRRAELIEDYAGKHKLKSDSESWRISSDYPLLTWYDGSQVGASKIPYSDNNKNINMSRISDEDIVKELQLKLQNGGCAGIILNTINRSQQMYQAIKNAFPDAEVQLYHKRFCSPDRASKEKYLLEKIGKPRSDKNTWDRCCGEKLIVIGTQVLEQSLDIDFDFLITDLCPIDLLLQRIGRLHRHSRKRAPNVSIPCCAVLENFKTNTNVYDIWTLEQAEKLIPQQISLPGDISPLVQAAYSPDENSVLSEEYLKKIKMKRNNAKIFAIHEPVKIKEDSHFRNLLGSENLEDRNQIDKGVRDITDSISVLIMQKDKTGCIRFLPWINNGDVVRYDEIPSFETAKEIAKQKINLPQAMSSSEVITILEKMNMKYVAMWQQAPFIKGELILLLDDKLEVSFGKHFLKYDKDMGLIYESHESKEK